MPAQPIWGHFLFQSGSSQEFQTQIISDRDLVMQVLGELRSPAGDGKVTTGAHYPPRRLQGHREEGRLPESTSLSDLLGVSITAGASW